MALTRRPSGAPVCCVVACDVYAGATKSATTVNVTSGAIRSLVTSPFFFPLVERPMNEYADDAFDSRITLRNRPGTPQPARLTTRRSVFSTTPIQHCARGGFARPTPQPRKRKTAVTRRFFTYFLAPRCLGPPRSAQVTVDGDCVSTRRSVVYRTARGQVRRASSISTNARPAIAITVGVLTSATMNPLTLAHFRLRSLDRRWIVPGGKG